MENLFEILKKTLNSDWKTVCFAIKMFGYWSRIVFEKFNYYPKSIKIPIDSRLKKIYSSQNTNLDIKDFFEKLSNDHKIPALHLDSLLRINYRKMVAVPTKNQQK
jgi:DNA-(apurinic or apyrimidinic site) lyase